MRRQQRIWEEEHKKPKFLPSIEYVEPSSGVIAFVDYLRLRNIVQPIKVVDIGCGKGRNSIYLAKLGFEVYGIDYSKYAIDFTKKYALKSGVDKNIRLHNTEIDRQWPFRNNFFDLAVDCFSSIDIETRSGRDVYKREMFRTLKPEGYALVMIVSTDDEIEREFLKSNPGQEKNSVIWPISGKFQKDYDEDELRNFYKEFNIIKFEEIKKSAFKLGRNYTATNFWLILQKPK